jgi:branched-chain amino acid transport system substrate-binding protein
VRRAAPILLVALTAVFSACGDDDRDQSTRVRGDTLTIYASLPEHGLSARAGAVAEAGMRRALAESDGRAGGRAVRFVAMTSTRLGDETWDPGTVEANADRAAEDPTTIAYLGEFDRGASAISLPVTNREQILQLSPADALTSLTQRPPGRPRAGPERYYPGGRRTFVRLVEPDLLAAREIVAELHARDTRRLAIVTGDGIADHELEAMVLGLIGAGQPRTVTRVGAPGDEDDPESVADLSRELVEADPQAIVYAAADGDRTRAALSALSVQLPRVPLMTPTLTHQRTLLAASGRCPRRLGYEAMRLTLGTIDRAGPDRLAVVRAARAASSDFSACP